MKHYFFCYIKKGTDQICTGYLTAKDDRHALLDLKWYHGGFYHPETLMFKEVPADIPIRERMK